MESFVLIQNGYNKPALVISSLFKNSFIQENL